VGREEHVEGALRALGHRSLHRPDVVLRGRLAVERASLATVTVEHEEGEREPLRLARELEAPREEDGPVAQAVPGLNDEREPREAAEGQLGEAWVGARHVLKQRHAFRKVVVEHRGARGGHGIAIFLIFLEKLCAIHEKSEKLCAIRAGERFSTKPGAPRLVENVIMIRKIEEASAEYLEEDGTIKNGQIGKVAEWK
jgi:hypothetical protein